MKTIISYNVNGIRAAIRKGLLDWIAEGQYDILCFQETKANLDQVDVSPFEALGYHHHWHSADKKGYSGVAVFSKIVPDSVKAGCGIGEYDCEGRVLQCDFGAWTLLNCYFPSGTSGELRQGFKMQFLEDFYAYVNQLKQERQQLIIVGDYNIAHTENDIHDPKKNKNNSGFLPEERAWMSKWFDNGFTDAFRYLHPDKTEYSWWSYRANARNNNKGWRLDYQSVTNNLQDKLVAAHHIKSAEHSDHCPVFLQIDI